MFEKEFANADMLCIPEKIYEYDELAILEWRDHLPEFISQQLMKG